MIIDDRHRLEFNRDSNYVTIIRISEDVPFACEMGVTGKNGISSENEHREKNWDKNLQKVYEKGATLFLQRQIRNLSFCTSVIITEKRKEKDINND